MKTSYFLGFACASKTSLSPRGMIIQDICACAIVSGSMKLVGDPLNAVSCKVGLLVQDIPQVMIWIKIWGV